MGRRPRGGQAPLAPPTPGLERVAFNVSRILRL